MQPDSAVGAFIGANAKKPRRGRPKGSLGKKSASIRAAVLDLTDEYKVMTVRGAFYQLVSRGVVPKDENAGYRPVQIQILKMRREGVLPWRFIADGARWMRKPESYFDVDDAIRHMHRSYRRNLWASQGVRLEIWLEKDALAGVVTETTAKWDVPLMVSRGMSSATFLYSAALAAISAWDEGITTMVYALYDYDAAGRRAARNIEKGLREHAPGVPIEFELLGVTKDQIHRWQLPTRPAKASDPEARKFGADAVELDAIPPDRLTALVESAITCHIDDDAWDKELLVEADERSFLRRLAGVA